MTWFRNLFAPTSRPRPAARPRPDCRPRLEALEDRQLLNASTAFDAAGHQMRLLVDNNGKLTESFMGQTTTLATGVARAHAYRDSDGSIGITVIYNNGLAAFDYDHTGGHYLGKGIYDVDKAFDTAGHLQEDVTYYSGGKYGTFEFTNTSAQQIAQGSLFAVYVHPFQDYWGNIGEEVTYQGGAGTSLIEYDSSGAHYLGQNAVADKAYDPTDHMFALDVTYQNQLAIEYTDVWATTLGTNIST
jgi:hypothetical protein